MQTADEFSRVELRRHQAYTANVTSKPSILFPLIIRQSERPQSYQATALFGKSEDLYLIASSATVSSSFIPLTSSRL